ncbi:uncharacterized protein RJT21DRAFT_5119 [Scheffersomyces amazonensis]|uniref:uncharacterized protein n=1 Tax=Scheffersomyces amazonensis TaxID=1078765 RepID=UPI00315C59AC
MPVDILTTALFEGTDSVPGWEYIKTYAPLALALGSIKYYFRGATNTWERDLHGKVYLLTGGTSGVGAHIAYELAMKGAQVILLVRSMEDIWVVDFVNDLREKTNNILIYAEECDLNSLYSVRKFATKWLDNQPPRRLDGVICCAAEAIPSGRQRQFTIDGVEKQLGINYFSHYHLLTLLGPSLRVQPPDRDVRVVLATCTSQAIGTVDLDDLLWKSKTYPKNQPWKIYGTSKLLLGLFAREYQKRISEYERKDGMKCNVTINLVNPGIMRTPSTRRVLSMGTLWGLFLYLILYPIWYLFLKSARQGAQSFYFALFAPIIPKIEGGNYIQECKINPKVRKEYNDFELQKELFDKTEKIIEELEKKSALVRNSQKSASEKKREKRKENKKKADLAVQPKSSEELDSKLNKLRNELGIGINRVPDNLPLFPSENERKNISSSGSSSGSSATGSTSKAQSSKRKNKK